MDLSHDGDIEHSGVNNCQNEKYIMTTSLGPGKEPFSVNSFEADDDRLMKPVRASHLGRLRSALSEWSISNSKSRLPPNSEPTKSDQSTLSKSILS